MKKPIILVVVVLVIILLVVLVSCNMSKNSSQVDGDTSKNNSQVSDNQGNEGEQAVDKYAGLVGTSVSGSSVKNLINTIIQDNNKLDSNKKSWVKLDAFKGSVSSSGDTETLERIFGALGNDFSTYQVEKLDNYSDNQITYFKITQKVGNSEDPDIPEYEDFNYDYFMPIGE